MSATRFSGLRAVIFFDPTTWLGKCLAAAEPFRRTSGRARSETMRYLEDVEMENWHKFDRKSDVIMLKKLDLNTIRTVAGVIGRPLRSTTTSARLMRCWTSPR